MLAILFATVALQGPLSIPDVSDIVQLVVEETAPVAGKTSGRPIGDRPVFFGSTSTAKAFRDLVPGLDASHLKPQRPHRALEQADAVFCGAAVNVSGGAAPSCQVRDDGVFVSVLSARRTDDGTEVLVNVRVLWTAPLGSGTRTLGYDVEMYLARSEGAWRITRKGVAVAR